MYERIEEDGKIKPNLIRPWRINDWISPSCLGGPYVYSPLDSVTVRKIQAKLKKEKWYQGPVDGVLNMPTYFAFKFYNVLVLNHQDEEYCCIIYPTNCARTTSLVALEVIDNPFKIIQNIQTALKERGYGVGEINNIFNEKTRQALIQYQKDNGLPEGQLDFETLKKLEIKY